ncbi:MAG: PIG-L family deacetylase [Acidobacteria bacterium]|nr:PIG-L family deacetylase [Acidobacteriota bacterium]
MVLAPHTDDGEFGCGGTIAKLIENGSKVFYVAFSSAEQSVPSDYPKDILKKEVLEATKILGIEKSNVMLFNFQVRTFPLQRQEILEEMIRLKNEINPQIIFLPSTHDTHQDHKVIAEEGFRAFKHSTMLGYEVPWNNLTFATQGFFVLEDLHIEIKIRSLKCYKSQSFRPYCTEEFIISLARTRGTQIGKKYAEAFEVVRWIR